MDRKYQCKNIIASGHTTVNMSRLSLLKWVNNVLGTKIEKVEALGSGAAYCQMFNILFPGCIPLKKVKFEATQSHDFWINFKQLQMGFRAVGCEKEILIDTLIKGKFQDNFEFLQWFKRFYDLNYDESTCSKPVKDPQTSSPKKAPSRKIITVYTLAEKEMKLKTELAEYQAKAEKVMEEKDFYFNKLRNVEILCTAEGAALSDKEFLVNKIMAELYETAEGFEPPEGPQEESQEESEDMPQDEPQEESEDMLQDEPQEESEDMPQDEPQVGSQDE